MAADGRSTCDNMIQSDQAVKIHRLKNGGIGGWCGKAAIQNAFFDWLDSPKSKRPNARFPERDEDSSGIVLNPDGTVTFYGSCGFPYPRALPAADGSGGHIAVGAMEAGATPQEAVTIAARRDPHTGGKITVMKL
jgi:ATP-dependent protease HslVU (ClpYQ) peptidase subunit